MRPKISFSVPDEGTSIVNEPESVKGRFTEQRFRAHREARHASIVQPASGTARPVAFDDSMHPNQIVLRRFEFDSRAAASNQQIPLVIHIPQEFGVLA
jgi:hypothetical protein